MKMCKELENKSIDDEKRVSENHVNIENIQMNVSMQYRTTTNLIEDRK